MGVAVALAYVVERPAVGAAVLGAITAVSRFDAAGTCDPVNNPKLFRIEGILLTFAASIVLITCISIISGDEGEPSLRILTERSSILSDRSISGHFCRSVALPIKARFLYA